MKQLPKQMTVAQADDETPASFCSRNALLVGRSARNFCRDAGFTFQNIVDGEPSPIDALAHRCRGDRNLLSSNATVKVGERRYMIGNQVLTRDTLSRIAVRVCPRCVVADIEAGRGPIRTRPYGRLHWQVEPIRTCREHGVSLITASTDKLPGRVHDFAVLVQPCLSDLDRLLAATEKRQWSRLEEHLAERLASQETSAATWLHTLPFYAAAKTCEILGAIAIHGSLFNSRTLSDAEWHEAGATGYEIAADGEPGIRHLLGRLQKDFSSSKRGWGACAVYGRLYEWLAHETVDPAYASLREMVRQHAIETMPVGPGDQLFGQEVTERRMHSVRTASLETGAHPKRLRKLLHAAGHISETALALSNERILFDATSAGEFLGQVSEAMSLRDAGTYLNAPAPHPRLLIEAGFIRPFVKGGTHRKGGIHTLKDHAFAKRELDAFLDRLLARANPLQAGELSFRSIPAAAKHASCSAMEIVRLIIDGTLSRVRYQPDRKGYLSVEVDPDEVKPLVRGHDHGHFTLREVERKLCASTPVVKALADRGHLPSRIALNPVSRCPQRVVPKDEFDRFVGRFASLHMLAKESAMNISTVAGLLRDAGIKPAFDPNSVHATFYERAVAAESISRMAE